MEKMLLKVLSAGFMLLAIASHLCIDGVPVGYKMYAGSDAPLESPNKNFGFGFHKSDVSGSFKLAIWYLMTPETLIWTAMVKNGTSQEPLQVGQNAQLELQSTGLYVTDDDSQTLWRAEVLCNACVSGASLNDSGNFVLINNASKTIWQSFEHPSDTIIPGQDLVGNMSLVAGKYRLSMNKSSVGLYFDEYSPTESYWSIMNSQLADNDTSLNHPPKLVLYQNGPLSFFDGNGTSFYRSKYDNAQRYPVDYMNVSTSMRRITLEKNGSLRSYSLAQGENSWRPVWQSNLLECEVYGTCGAFGLCKYAPRKHCECPAGFHQLNSDETAGCNRTVQLDTCSNSTSNSKTKLVEVSRAEYQGNEYYRSPNATSLEECRSLCLRDCKCLAASYKLDGSGLCILKSGGNKSALYNGLQSPERAVIGLIKVSSSDTSAVSELDDIFTTYMNATSIILEKRHTKSYLSKASHVMLVAFAGAEFLVFCLVALGMWLCWRRTTKKMWKKLAQENQGAVKYSYEQLQAATNNFTEKLGTGGFGSVYKGVLPNKTLVAVKVLEGATGAENQFKMEVTTLGRIHHVNLVRLLGYCAEDQHRMLVYEYMSNGSLDQLLQANGQFHKVWKIRYSIAVGVARGLSYLHEECYERILHCDIKPHNILLDKNLCPKVSDFGLAKLMGAKELGFNVTTIRGTRGYLAPEWIGNRPITAKADVYSYGMVLIELLCGQAKLADSNFLPQVFEKYNGAEWRAIADPSIIDGVDWHQFERMLKVSFWCIQSDPSSRPSMSTVVRMLEDYDMDLQMPPTPVLPEIHLASSGSSAPESQSILEPR